MWITLSSVSGRGPHKVFVPKEFGKMPEDFSSVDEFLKALRAWRKKK